MGKKRGNEKDNQQPGATRQTSMTSYLSSQGAEEEMKGLQEDRHIGKGKTNGEKVHLKESTGTTIHLKEVGQSERRVGKRRHLQNVWHIHDCITKKSGQLKIERRRHLNKAHLQVCGVTDQTMQRGWSGPTHTIK